MKKLQSLKSWWEKLTKASSPWDIHKILFNFFLVFKENAEICAEKIISLSYFNRRDAIRAYGRVLREYLVSKKEV